MCRLSMRLLKRDMAVFLAVVCLGCNDMGPVEDPVLCPQTREFSNLGCARFAAVVTHPDGRPAADLSLRATPLDAAAGQPVGTNSQRTDDKGRVGLQLTWYWGPVPVDSARFRIVAFVFDAARNISTRVDSLDVYLRFVEVGKAAIPDTTRWRLPE